MEAIENFSRGRDKLLFLSIKYSTFFLNNTFFENPDGEGEIPMLLQKLVEYSFSSFVCLSNQDKICVRLSITSPGQSA